MILVPTWKRHRKVLMPTLNQSILNSFVEVFAEKAEILVEQLQKVAGKGEFDIYNYISRCALDIFCGKKFRYSNNIFEGCPFIIF